MAEIKDLNLERITNILKEHKEELKEKYRVKEIGIFGSYVRKSQKKTSDVDILVEFEKNAKIGLLRFINLQNYISDFLGVKVDLVSKKALKPRIGKHILREVIYL
ncbi:MAG: nucleotidyltransferase family protein [Deltaproteobacteria bacterium]|nr:nucleotidyltransferase family protein [Deltaproteobacteria bacterium]